MPFLQRGNQYVITLTYRGSYVQKYHPIVADWQYWSAGIKDVRVRSTHLKRSRTIIDAEIVCKLPGLLHYPLYGYMKTSGFIYGQK